MKQSQGRVELRRAGQSPNPGPLSGAGISISQSVDAFGNLAQHMPEADVESPRGLVQKTELSELLEFNFFFLNFSVCGEYFKLFSSGCFVLYFFRRLSAEEPHSHRRSVRQSFGSVFSFLCINHPPTPQETEAGSRMRPSCCPSNQPHFQRTMATIYTALFSRAFFPCIVTVDFRIYRTQ